MVVKPVNQGVVKPGVDVVVKPVVSDSPQFICF